MYACNSRIKRKSGNKRKTAGKGRNGILDVIRRESVRVILERFQGERLKKDMSSRSLDKWEEESEYEVKEILNRPYMNRQEIPLAMDIFKPKVEEGKELPVIVSIHGGGLVLGDRKMHRDFARVLAGHGYLVFTVEYRLAPRANAAEQLDDVCAGLDLVGRELVNFDVDFTRIFLTAESAGAYLAIYVAAMKGSEALQKAIGYEPSRVKFKALGLISGMYYTQKKDPIGFLLAEQFFGDKNTDKNFIRYMNPEDPEIIDNLPPVFLVTSRGDFLNNYTIMFHRALKKAGRETHIVYYGEDELQHAFVTKYPNKKQSRDAINRMISWFEAEADAARVSMNLNSSLRKQIPEKTGTDEVRTAAGEKSTEPGSENTGIRSRRDCVRGRGRRDCIRGRSGKKQIIRRGRSRNSGRSRSMERSRSGNLKQIKIRNSGKKDRTWIRK